MNGQDNGQRHRRTKKDYDLRLASWNVRTLRGQDAREAVRRQLGRYRIDIAAVQETRYTGHGERLDPDYKLYYSSHSNGYGGTGFYVSSKIQGSVIDFKPVSERLCTLRIRGRIFNISLICAYAPTEDATPEKKEDFYGQLEGLYDSVPKGDVKIVLGDLNAKIGREANYFPTIGRFSLHQETNDNGTRAIHFAAANRLVIGSTWFQHRRVHKATWRLPGGARENQIDHIFIEGRHFASLQDVRSMRGADCNSDHYMVVGKYRARIANDKKKGAKRADRWDVAKLTDDAIRFRYQDELRAKLGQVEEGTSVEQAWSHIKTSVLDTTREVLGVCPKTKKAGWFDDECRAAMEEREQARARAQQSRSAPQRVAAEKRFAEARRKARKIFRKKKREFRKRKLDKLEGFYRTDETRKFFREVNAEKNGYQPRLGFCRSGEGELLTNKEAIIDRWAEYFEELLNVSSQANDNEPNPLIQVGNVSVKPLTFEETEKAIRALKLNKAPGEDGICAEMLKNGGEELHRHIHRLVVLIWEREEIPEDWKVGIICPLHKKGDRTNCTNYRGITLLSAVYKVLSTVLQNRLTKVTEHILGEYQCGFRPGRSTIDQIFGVRQSMERQWEHNSQLHQLFIDFQKAYDSINRNVLWRAMAELGVPDKYIRLARATLHGTRARVRVEGDLSRDFDIVTGVKQGDGLSCLLFNLALEWAIQRAYLRKSGTIVNRQSQVLAFADDIDIMGRNANEVDMAYTALKANTEALGLRVNVPKTKYMSMGNQPGNGGTINLGGDEIEVVQSFKYLGATVNSSNNISEEIRNRVLAGNRGQYALGRILRAKNVSRGPKLRIYQAILQPVVLYGCETWTLTQADEQMLDTWERKVLRIIYGPIVENGVWRSRYNHELYKLYNQPRISRIVKSSRLRYAGHVMRMGKERHPIAILEARPYILRRAGRPRRRWIDNVEADLTKMKVRDWRSRARNRVSWRRVVEDARTHIGL